MAVSEMLETKIAQLYVGLIGRAPDRDGLEFWARGYNSDLDKGQNADAALRGVAQRMFDSDGARDYYPEGLSDQQIVEQFYENVLGRQGDAEGIAYWTDALAKSGTDTGDVLVSMIDAVTGYSGDDPAGVTSKQLFENKAAVADYYVDNVSQAGDAADIAGATALLDSVTAQSRSVNEQISSMTIDRYDSLIESSSFSEYSDSDDDIKGTESADFIDAGAGFDTVDGAQGDDLIKGGSGDDDIIGGRGADYLEGGAGSDKLYAGPYSSFNYSSSDYESDVSVNILKGGGGSDELYGGYGRDVLRGGDGADLIFGEEERGLPNADADSDWVYDDNIQGGLGNDTINSGLGDDIINGGAGDDSIDAGDGLDIIFGGPGDDAINAGLGDVASDQVLGGNGDDTITATSGDIVDGGSGNDSFSIYRGNEGAKTKVLTGQGGDFVRVDHTASRVTDHVVIDLAEQESARDLVELDTGGRPTAPIDIRGFEFETDALSLGRFDYDDGYNLFGSAPDESSRYSITTSDYYSTYDPYEQSYVQIVDSVSEPWDDDKGIFVIHGASAKSGSREDVAAFLDDYGDNAQYLESSVHYFFVNVADAGVGVYRFEDDTGANGSIVLDELSPVVRLLGLDTEHIDRNDMGLFVAE